MNKKIIFILMLPIVVLGQAAVDLYLPSLPSIANEFHVLHYDIEITIALYLFGIGISQLIYGPLSDYFGRRPILLIGLTVFFIASIGCALSSSIYELYFFRLLQGLGIGAGPVLYRSILRDIFTHKALMRALSLLFVTWSLSPLFAPAIGGYVETYLNWHASFWLLSLYCLTVLVLLFFYLPESNSYRGQNKIRLRTLLTGYHQILFTQSFYCAALSSIAIATILIVFSANAPFLFEIRLHLTAVEFGWTMLFIASSYMLGSLSNTQLLKYLNVQTIFYLGSILIVISAGAMLGFVLTENITVLSLIITACMIFLGCGLTFSNSVAKALQDFDHQIGFAAALQSSLQTTGVAVILFSTAAIHMSILLVLAVSLLAMGLLALFGILLSNNKIVVAK